jgi:murein DD-endopeptidase MepM/ murein hydrolase activator NlpD
MTPQTRFRHLLPIALGAIALAAPASSLAIGPATTTSGQATPDTTTATPPPEAPAPRPVTSSTEAAPAPTPTPTPVQTPAGSGTPQVATTTPQVQAEHSQGATAGAPSSASDAHGSLGGAPASGQAEAGQGSVSAGPRAKHPARSPSTLTPSLPLALESSIAGVPGFFIESFRIPPFLLPIFQAAGTAYGVPWQVLAAINEVETDYGRDLSVSSAGAEGWMQFLPAEWVQYGVDANGDGLKDPYNPADAIFAAARYLRAAGGASNIRTAVYSYNHSQAYVSSVLLRAQLLGGTPSELLGSITGLTEAHFPVHAASHFGDGFPTLAERGSAAAKVVPGATIYSQAGAPVIAVQDGEIVQVGDSPSLGRFVSLRDAFGNTYTYAELGDVAALYPVIQPHVQSTVSKRIDGAGGNRFTSEPTPSGPATAGAQPRSPVSEGATVSGLALGAAAGLEAAPPAVRALAAPSTPPVPSARTRAAARVFRAGPNDVYLHPLRAGVQVIAGTVIGHLGSSGAATATASAGEPHIIFQIRPAGAGAPLIDPKPILDGWVALENTSIFKARGENPFLATSPTVGQVLLESKQQLEPQVLHDAGVRLGACGRQAVQGGRVDRRVLAMLEYLSVSGLKPTASGLTCAVRTQAASAANAPASADETLKITAVNGVAVAGHQGSGSVTDITVRKLLMLQGLSRPRQIVSLMSYPGAAGALAKPSARDAIEVAFGALSGDTAHAAGAPGSILSPSEWSKLIARLGEIPDPTVARGPSPAAIPDKPGASSAGTGSETGGNR